LTKDVHVKQHPCLVLGKVSAVSSAANTVVRLADAWPCCSILGSTNNSLGRPHVHSISSLTAAATDDVTCVGVHVWQTRLKRCLYTVLRTCMIV